MPFFLEDPRRKPEKWGFDKGLVAPEWRWAWRNLKVALPLWERGGAPREIASGIPVSLGGSPSPTWGSSIYGPVMESFEFGNLGRLEFDSPQWLLDLPTTYNFTVEFWFNRNNVGTEQTACAWEGTDDLVLSPNDNAVGSGGTRVFWRDLGGNIVSEDGPDLAGEWHQFVFVSRAANDHECYRDGISVGTSSATGAAGPFSSFRVGGFTTTINSMQGSILFLRVFDRAITDLEIRLLYADLFGPFRMEDIAPWATVAPPAAAIMAQMQFSNLGADLYDGALIQ